MKAKNGFTITELLIAAGLSSLIILMGTTLFIDSQKQEIIIRQNAFVSWNTMVISQLLGKVLRDAGGPTLRPWDAIRIEDNCSNWAIMGLPNCNGSDRVTIATEKMNSSNHYYPKMSVASYSLLTSKIVVMAPDINGNGIVDATECPLDSSLENSTMALMNASNTILRLFRTGSFTLSACEIIAYSEIQGEVLEYGAIGSETFLNGSAIPVDLKTIYLDTSTNKIMKLKKISSAATSPLSAEDLHIYAEGVYDLQFALGFDVGSRNRIIQIDNSDTDEVLYNHSSDSMANIGGTGATKNDLKMLFVGVIVGTPQYKATALGNSLTILNGTPKSFPNLYLFSVERRFYLRNVLDFL